MRDCKKHLSSSLWQAVTISNFGTESLQCDELYDQRSSSLLIELALADTTAADFNTRGAATV